MQLERLPGWVHKALDRAVRSCIWGGYGGKRGLHLLSWEVLTRTKAEGGANMNSVKEMNWALLAKLAWRTLKCKDQIWRRVVASKYKVGDEDGAHFRERQRASQVWKGLVWVADLLRRGIVWKVHNGKSVMFWDDHWLLDRPLIDAVELVVEEGEQNLKVSEY